MSPRDEQRLEELLATLATEGLTASEDLELRTLLHRDGDADADVASEATVDSWLMAAAAVDLAFAEEDLIDAPLPETLKSKVEEDAKRFFANKETASPSSPSAQKAPLKLHPTDRQPNRTAPASAQPTGMHTRRNVLREFSGWGIAAAAILVAILGWLPEATPPALTPGDELALLKQEDPNLLRLPWGGPGGAASTVDGSTVEGSVWWSPTLKKGYLEFSGLPKNDPKKDQYQLWIVDPARDARPVDGGVFDITEGSQIVRIEATLDVIKAAAFAVTREQPGGVVVSDGPHLVVAAVP